MYLLLPITLALQVIVILHNLHKMKSL